MPFKVEVEIETGEIRKLRAGTCELASWDARSMTAILRPEDPGHEAFSSGCDHGMVALQKVSGLWREVTVDRATVATQPSVSVEQGMNSPPLLVAVDPGNGTKTVLLDPNPQFAALDFAAVEEINFQGSDGTPWKGGVYLPLGAKAGQRYPLVIQTHGWDRQRFEIDGESTAGYAAQALAGAGMVVAQLPFEVQDQSTVAEGPKSMAQYQGLIDELDKRGLIDRHKVGLQGWSRTGYTVRYALSFSKYPIAAALIADGMEAGYVQYMLDSKFSIGINMTFEALNGGVPFGSDLEIWLKNSPMFHLENVHAPVLQFMLGPYSYRNMWESFTALRRLCKPVEMIYLPESNHWPLRPLERMAVQDRAADWFRFWLNDEEDADPSKTEQYTRWRKLRALREADLKGRLRTFAATQPPAVLGCSTF
jgi:dipeptidyl aminopeptidase/acylaminoacyl peptidase